MDFKKLIFEIERSFENESILFKNQENTDIKRIRKRIRSPKKRAR